MSDDRWWELLVEVPSDTADDVAALLIDAGSMSAQLIDNVDDLPPDLDGRRPEISGVTKGKTLVLAFYEAEAAATSGELLKRFYDVFPNHDEHGSAPTAIARHDASWREKWKTFFSPKALGQRVWVLPAWKTDVDLPKDAISVIIDPGMAFGTGHHATTELCTQYIEKMTSTAPPNSMLDVGCGSGILSIAALSLGVGRVTAVDVDPLSVRATNDNLKLNPQCDPQSLTVYEGSADGQSPHHWVVANIISHILLTMTDDLIKATQVGGTLLLSGIPLVEEDQAVSEFQRAATRLGRTLEFDWRSVSAEWVALAATVR